MVMNQHGTSYTQLAALEVDHAHLAALVESLLNEALSCFERRDLRAATAAIAADKRIDDLHRRIETRVFDILQHETLTEEQLRHVLSTMKVAGELERVGDLAKNVAKRTLVISEFPPVHANSGVTRMGRASLRQVSDILNAFNGRNLAAAKAVWGGDDELDELYNSVYQEILLAMMKDPGQVNACTHLVFIAKNFERVGDHATNIAEALHFLLTGKAILEERPKGDETSVTTVDPESTKQG